MLPVRDAAYAAQMTGDISLGEAMLFDGAENNRLDWRIYKQRLEMIDEQSDYAMVHMEYNDLGSIIEHQLHMTTRNYIARGWSVRSDMVLSHLRGVSGSLLPIYPYSGKYLSLSIRKKSDRSEAGVSVGLSDALGRYPSISIDGTYRLTSRVTLDGAAAWGKQASETTALKLGGYKSLLHTGISFRYLPHTTISASVEYDRFYGQDHIMVGDGLVSRLQLQRQVHLGYPDLTWSIYLELGKYRSRKHPASIIDALVSRQSDLIPSSYYSVGAHLMYGTINRDKTLYTWRPYAEFSPSYKSTDQDIHLSWSAGYSGAIHPGGYITTGVSYDHTTNTHTKGTARFFVDYKFLY